MQAQVLAEGRPPPPDLQPIDLISHKVQEPPVPERWTQARIAAMGCMGRPPLPEKPIIHKVVEPPVPEKWTQARIAVM